MIRSIRFAENFKYIRLVSSWSSTKRESWLVQPLSAPGLTGTRGLNVVGENHDFVQWNDMVVHRSSSTHRVEPESI